MMRRKKEAGKQTGQTDGQLQRVGTVQSSRVVCSYVGSSERGCTGEAGGQVGLEMDFPSPPFELCRPPTLFLPVLLSLSLLVCLCPSRSRLGLDGGGLSLLCSPAPGGQVGGDAFAAGTGTGMRG